ncbi:HlyD family secretion protein [Rhizobium sp. P38BS-XIX]|uniref:HlyD family secretion protein n=1 Tax=Rhizobium sp. P38BS-XIX TaxID=2726740 RepID=UPI00145771F1|nr:HlyD family secretion protein [Rhizobium sp. P38BS-XIX]NLS01123.1 HlyD family secretion protein [Rhizobium sp. P38BS-XIX]
MNQVVSEADIKQGAVSLKPKRSLKKPVGLLIGIAILAGAGWYGNYWWQTGRWQQTTDDAYVGGNTTALSPRVSGHVEEVLVEDNQLVKAGQLLVRLDPSTYKTALSRAEALVKQQQASLDNLHAQLTMQASLVKQAEADLAAKKAAANFTGIDAERYRNLASQSTGTEQNAQKAVMADTQAKAAVDASDAGLTAARQQIDVLNTQIEQAQAALESARQDVETARLNLGYTEVRSPIDGYAGNRAAQIGAFVSDGSYLLSVIPAGGLWIDANFKEDQLAVIKVGQTVDVVADIYPGHTLRGRVSSIAPATGATFSVIPPENATGNFTKIVQRVPVRIALDDAAPQAQVLRPGLSTTVTVDTHP